jgi:hypothetical protein
MPSGLPAVRPLVYLLLGPVVYLLLGLVVYLLFCPLVYLLLGLWFTCLLGPVDQRSNRR